MAQISKMNINGTPYDLAGGAGGTSYIAGDGITIDANGRISVQFPEYLTSEQLADLREELLQNQAMITGDLNVLTGEVENGSMIMTYMNSEIAGIKASVWSSEGMWNTIEMLPDSIKTTIVRDWTSEGGLLTKFEHEMLLTNSESYDKIMQYINDSSEGSFVRYNEFSRTAGELLSYISEVDCEGAINYSQLRQTTSEISAIVSSISEGMAQLLMTTSEISQTVSGLDNNYSTISQKVETILAEVNKGDKYTGVSVDEDGVKITKQKGNTQDYALFTDDGMQILQDGTVIAKATSDRFWSTKMQISGWLIESPQSKLLNFHVSKD